MNTYMGKGRKIFTKQVGDKVDVVATLRVKGRNLGAEAYKRIHHSVLAGYICRATDSVKLQ